ncbi:MAG: isochorismatase family protein [Phycisphaeraceae bacterium]
MPTLRLDPDHTAIVLVDVQERLVPAMHNAEPLVRQVGRLLDAAAVLDLPVLVTEQYPDGLGQTMPALASHVARSVCRHDKTRLSACIGPIRDELARLQARCVLVAGLEAHVCVAQTCLDLLEQGYLTGVVADATGSRNAYDREIGLQRLFQAGVMPLTVESAVLELLGDASHDKFRDIHRIIK